MLNKFVLYMKINVWRPTACVTGAGAGVDSAWEQRNLEARKMFVNRAESPASSARFVGQPLCLPKRLLKKDTTANTPKFYTQLNL
jgi:hypothetical protein